MSTGRIATRDVAGLIDDGRIPDWHTVRHVVIVLRGQPAAVEALWARARSTWSHAAKTSSTRIPLGALG
ncbi:hypothetical protein [Kitasatospora cineracea]|uniref:Uncharacterized protein n=1 Tax=Kitasatospora cineracea TaxID=88074 RepID=A0A8G1USG2_9ACTN|nr:hypothetical protein [Kitasatospora cineracea]ROR47012.1 hypothetical protein EDD39_5324 [Kitasatospora cineracea]